VGRAEISEDALPGVVVANVGYWASLSRSGNTANVISSDRGCAMGAAGSYSDNLVEVVPV